MLIGRQREVAEVVRFVQNAAEEPAGLLILGEPGIGKTVLWDAGVHAAREAGHLVLTARPGEADRDLPYAGLADLLAAVDVGEAVGVPAAQRAALDVALQRGDAGGGADRLAVSLGLLALLPAAAAERAVTLAIDDLQWLDLPSARALSFALRRATGQRVRVLASARTQQTPESLVLPAAFAEERLEVVPVEPLGPLEIGRLLQERLDLTLPPPAVARVTELSAGNPLHALELARALPPGGRLAAGTWPRGAEAGVTALVDARVAALGADARRICAAAAALGRPTSELLGRLGSGLGEALAAGVLVMTGERVRFSHPLLATSAARALPPHAARALHAELADLVEDPVERALQRALGTSEPDAAVASELEAAAGVAAGRGAPESAAELAERSRQLTPPEHEHDATRRSLLAARQHHAAGDGPQARVLLEQLAVGLGPGEPRAQACLLLADVTEDFAAARGWLQEARRSAIDEPAARGLAHQVLSVHAFVGGRFAEAERHSVAATRLARRSGDPVQVAHALSDLAFVRFHRGHGLQRELAERAFELLRGTPEADFAGAITRPRADFASQLHWSDQFDEARHLLDAELEDARRTGNLNSLVETLLHLVQVEIRAGRWGRADTLAEELRDLGARTRIGNSEAASLFARAHVDAHLGRERSAREGAVRGRELSLSFGDWLFAQASARALGLLELSLGDLEAAHRALAQAAAEHASSGLLDPRPILSDAAEAAAGVGETAAAEGLLAIAEERSRRTGRLSMLAAIARVRALLAAERADHALADAYALEALDVHARLHEPFEHGRTLLAHGAVLRRAGRRSDSRAALEQAREIFDRLGAGLWRQRVAREAGRIGGRRAAGDDLTPTEDRVAALVARGRTNKQVAAELFVTEKTVEANLSRIYRKLGVRSRTELAHRLAGGGGANHGDPPDAGGPARP